ncbi:CAAX prenyl protease-like protein [Lutibacter sp. Hel_I_33_5]|uniref:CPBP family intramembrane glutamic endopeptidase n=1 Tax=Lutibacter sp. Hel_I_33_5 TaxID=1566289 RepID=UPI00119FE3E5|nr:CPBP family intramembrane glutamic endopeptidase [Lutibacter sp. Hel_I_33_5]TVZ55008.1 CAAX prenyl protease-like protein [Lutibacter sp. Hel_I_33_5]
MQTNTLTTTFFTLFTIIFIAVFPHLGLITFFPMIYTVPVILLVWLNLKINKESFSDINFRFKDINFKSFIIGILTAILIYLFMRHIFFPFLELFITFKEADVDLYNDLREKGTTYYLIILVLGWIVGGFYESIVFHAFTFSQLEKIIDGKYKTVISFMITSLIFGVYHYQLGTADMINAFVIGIIYLGMFLFYKRNLWNTIFCHGAYNTIAITLLHLGYI